LAPGRPDLLVERARVRKDQGDAAGAIDDLEAVLRLTPAPREALLARERLDELRAPPCDKPAGAQGP
ncbi:MAG: hypothetical protein KF878_27745, partial [Planctomycetes bacterium]|nr:hypothetical protein [Planctomycetota bacterium]